MTREYPERPLVGIGVVVLGARGVLMIKRGKAPRKGQWSLPGGAQELGETVSEAARREVMEETGLTIGILGLVDVVDSIRRDDAGKIQYHYTLVEFLARIPPSAETEHPVPAAMPTRPPGYRSRTSPASACGRKPRGSSTWRLKCWNWWVNPTAEVGLLYPPNQGRVHGLRARRRPGRG